MKKVIILIAIVGVLASIGSYFFQQVPSCTYEYGINWNALKFEQACQKLKDENTAKRQEQENKILEAKKQQSVYSDSSNWIREVQDKVAQVINDVRKQDNFAFRKAE
jgi:hypothetical protein